MKENPGLDIITKFVSFIRLWGCFHLGKSKKASMPSIKKKSAFLYLTANFLKVSMEYETV